MRLPTFALAGALTLCLAVPAVASSGQRPFKGTTNEGGNVQFRISLNGSHVVKFRFANRCPADSNKGTLVPGRFKIYHGKTGILKFKHRDSQFRIRGRFVSSNKAKGTAQNDTGDCHSGKLHWTATAKP
jgi:hypothetical protein